MPNNTPKNSSTSEKGHAKFMESFDRLIAVDATLDPLKLNAPAALTSAALASLRTAAVAGHAKVGESKANWRTVALLRQTDADKLDSMATQAVALLESRGVSAETVEDARSYVRKLRGDRKTAAVKDNPLTLDVDESDGNISNSQQSNAAKISTFGELIDYLEAQSEYADVTTDGFKIVELRDFADTLQAKHNASIIAATTLETDRADRNGTFYTNDDSVLNRAKRYKKLVFGVYGGNSDEYRMVSEIPFQKPGV